MYCSPCKKIKSNVWYITFFFLVTTPTQLMKLGKFNWKCNWNPLVQTGIGTQRFPVDKCDHSDTKKTSTAITVFFSKSYLLSLWASALMYNGNGGRNQHSNTSQPWCTWNQQVLPLPLFMWTITAGDNVLWYWELARVNLAWIGILQFQQYHSVPLKVLSLIPN